MIFLTFTSFIIIELGVIVNNEINYVNYYPLQYSYKYN